MNILNIAKWELAKRTTHLSFVFLAYIILLLAYIFLIGVADGTINVNNRVVSVMSSMVPYMIFLVSLYIVALPTLSAMTEIRGNNRFFEGMREGTFVTVAATRLIFNILVVSLAYGLISLVTALATKSGVDSLNSLNLAYFPYIGLLFCAAIASPTIAMFSFIAGASIPRWQVFSLVFAAVLYVVIGGCLLWIWNSPIYRDVNVIIQCLSVILLFIAACWLYDNKFEIAA